MRVFRTCLGLVFSVLLCSRAVAAEYKFEWTVDLSGESADKFTGATFFPNADAPTGVVVSSGSQTTLLNGDGSEQWETVFEKAVATPATVADLDGDGSPEIVVALVVGDLVCLNANGTTKWTRPFGARPGDFNIIVAADVYERDGLELLYGGEDGWLNCLSAEGDLIWRFFGDKYWVGPPGVGDVDGDGLVDIVYGTDNGHIYCLTGSGNVKWRYAEPPGIFAPYGRSGANMVDLDGDGRVEILLTRSNVGVDSGLMALDGPTGTRKWITRDVLHGYISNATIDLDGDGLLETLHLCKGNWVYCVNADGSERWRTHAEGHGMFYAPSVADVNGDGALEIIVTVRDYDPETDACGYLLSATGEILDRITLGKCGKPAPAVGDIDGDGVLEAVIVTGRPNQVHAINWGGGGAVAWPSIRGDSAMTARRRVAAGSPGEPSATSELDVRVAQADTFLGDNVLEAEWARPAGPASFATVAVSPEGACREVRVAPIAEGATSATIPWMLLEPGRADLRLAVHTGRDEVATFAGVVEPKPADYCDYEQVARACDAAIAAAETGGADYTGLVARLAALSSARETVTKLVAMDAVSQAIAESASHLREEATAVRTLAESLRAFWEAGHTGSFVCWQDTNPWDRFEPVSVPERVEEMVPLHVTLFGNEFEDVALNLLNVSPNPINVRCVFTRPKPERGYPDAEPALAKHVTLRRAVRVPSQKRGMVNDLLPRLDESSTMSLIPGVTAQLWLVLDSYGLEPGTHELILFLGSMEQRPTFREIPVSIEVLPVSLPLGVYAQMNWVGVGADYPSDQELQDMIDHGISVVYPPGFPTLVLDAEGNVAEPIDWSATDAGLARLPFYFQLMIPRPPAVKWPEGVTAPEGGALFEKGFAASVRVLADHLAERGFGYDRWVFYPYDEPWLTGFSRIPALRAFCQRTKAVDPRIRNYANPAGLVRAEYLEEFKDLIDFWQPEMNLLKRDPELVAWFQENAGTFVAYEATEPAKDLLPLGYYRANGWLSWMFGLDGSGFWVYRDHDLFWPVEIEHYGAVFRTAAGVVPSRRWEASRDGVEDYRALYVLREEADRAEAAGRKADADRARALIDQAVEEVIAWQALTVDEVTRQTRDYELDFDLLQEYRERIGREIVRLREN